VSQSSLVETLDAITKPSKDLKLMLGELACFHLMSITDALSLIDTDIFCSISLSCKISWFEIRTIERPSYVTSMAGGRGVAVLDKEAVEVSFEYVLDKASPEAQAELLFHLDLFT
jgi:hypothetical protein